MKSKKILLKKQAKLLAEMKKIGPFVQGSISIVNRTCGTKTCSCMKGGKKHQAMLLNWKENKKSKTIYVPVALCENVKKWNDNWKKMKKILSDISDLQKEIINLR